METMDLRTDAWNLLEDIYDVNGLDLTFLEDLDSKTIEDKIKTLDISQIKMVNQAYEQDFLEMEEKINLLAEEAATLEDEEERDELYAQSEELQEKELRNELSQRLFNRDCLCNEDFREHLRGAEVSFNTEHIDHDENDWSEVAFDKFKEADIVFCVYSQDYPIHVNPDDKYYDFINDLHKQIEQEIEEEISK